MALSNAERQHRHRERRKQALRNTGAPRKSLARMLYDRYVTEPEAYGMTAEEIPFAVAEDISGLISADALGVALQVRCIELDGFEEQPDDDRDAVREMLGGAEYCKAVEQYFRDCHEVKQYNKGRKPEKRKEPPLPPPPSVT